MSNQPTARLRQICEKLADQIESLKQTQLLPRWEGLSQDAADLAELAGMLGFARPPRLPVTIETSGDLDSLTLSTVTQWRVNDPDSSDSVCVFTRTLKPEAREVLEAARARGITLGDGDLLRERLVSDVQTGAAAWLRRWAVRAAEVNKSPQGAVARDDYGLADAVRTLATAYRTQSTIVGEYRYAEPAPAWAAPTAALMATARRIALITARSGPLYAFSEKAEKIRWEGFPSILIDPEKVGDGWPKTTVQTPEELDALADQVDRFVERTPVGGHATQTADAVGTSTEATSGANMAATQVPASTTAVGQPKRGRAKVGEEKWRDALAKLLERLDQGKLPVGMTFEDAGKLIGHKESTTRTAIRKSVRLGQHFKLSKPEVDASTGQPAGNTGDILQELSGTLQRQLQVWNDETFRLEDAQEKKARLDQRDAIEQEWRSGDKAKAVELLTVLIKPVDGGSCGVTSVEQAGNEPASDGKVLRSRRKAKPVPQEDQDE